MLLCPLFQFHSLVLLFCFSFCFCFLIYNLLLACFSMYLYLCDNLFHFFRLLYFLSPSSFVRIELNHNFPKIEAITKPLTTTSHGPPIDWNMQLWTLHGIVTKSKHYQTDCTLILPKDILDRLHRWKQASNIYFIWIFSLQWLSISKWN